MDIDEFLIWTGTGIPVKNEYLRQVILKRWVDELFSVQLFKVNDLGYDYYEDLYNNLKDALTDFNIVLNDSFTFGELLYQYSKIEEINKEDYIFHDSNLELKLELFKFKFDNIVLVSPNGEPATIWLNTELNSINNFAFNPINNKPLHLPIYGVSINESKIEKIGLPNLSLTENLQAKLRAAATEYNNKVNSNKIVQQVAQDVLQTIKYL